MSIIYRARSLDQSYINTLHEQIAYYEKQKNVLLALSNDITRVSEGDDLINNLKKNKNRSPCYYENETLAAVIGL